MSGAATAEHGLPAPAPVAAPAARGVALARAPAWLPPAVVALVAALLRLPGLGSVRVEPVLRRRRAQHGDVLARVRHRRHRPVGERRGRQAARRPVAAGRLDAAARLHSGGAAPARGARRGRWRSLALYDLLGALFGRGPGDRRVARARGPADRGHHVAQRHHGLGDGRAGGRGRGADRARGARRPAVRCWSPPGPPSDWPSRSSCSRRSSAPRRSRRCGGSGRADRAGDARGPSPARGPSSWRSRWRGWSPLPVLGGGHRPWAFGSTDASAWNATFVYDGLDRLRGLPGAHTAPRTHAPGQAPLNARQARARAVALRRRAAAIDHRPAGPGPGRLFSSRAHLGRRLGIALGGALLAFALALLAGVPRSLDRLGRAGWWALGGWLATGLVLFSAQGTLKPALPRGLRPRGGRRARGGRGARGAPPRTARGARCAPRGRVPARGPGGCGGAAGGAARRPRAGLRPGRRRADRGRRRARRTAERPPRSAQRLPAGPPRRRAL